MSWFDEYDKAAAQEPVPETTVFPVVDDQAPADPVPQRQGARTLILGVSVLGVVALGALTAVGITSSLRAQPDDTPAATPVTVTSTVATTSPTSSAAPVAPKCPDQPPARQRTPEGAVVAFQQAYFAGDATALRRALDPKSYLANVDWITAAGDLIGSDICVTVIDTWGGVVEADTTVRAADGEELLLLQTITTTEADGVWKVSAIEDRPVPTST